MTVAIITLCSSLLRIGCHLTVKDLVYIFLQQLQNISDWIYCSGEFYHHLVINKTISCAKLLLKLKKKMKGLNNVWIMECKNTVKVKFKTFKKEKEI